MNHEQARQLFLGHCKPGGAATLQRYGTQAATDAIITLTSFIEAEARRYASMYPRYSDGRNTFTIFANMVSDLTAERACSLMCPECKGEKPQEWEHCQPCTSLLMGKEP